MKLHEDKKLFGQAVQFTSDQKKILPIYIEKDYWVTYALRTIFNDPVGEDTVFKGGTALSKCYSLIDRFDVRVLEPTRTLCEKIMSLVRFSYGNNPMDDLKKKIRHTYDLHQLLRQEEFSHFFDSPACAEMLLKVANDDVVSFRNNNQWLVYHPNEALMFRELDTAWKELVPVYNGEFKNLVYGAFPKDEAVLETLKKIKERLAGIEWTIKIPV